jgi:hypothetical protein
LFDIRQEIFTCLLGWQLPEANSEDLISYVGGRLYDLNPAWLWYQFIFRSSFRLSVDPDVGDLDDFNTLYTQWVLAPSPHLPVEEIPVTDFEPDMTSIIDFTKNPLAGAFDRGFSSGFYRVKDK